MVRETTGGVTLLYAGRCRKRTPYDRLMALLKASARSQEFSVEATPAPQPPPAPALNALSTTGGAPSQ
jgi:hypothetical protein